MTCLFNKFIFFVIPTCMINEVNSPPINYLCILLSKGREEHACGKRAKVCYPVLQALQGKAFYLEEPAISPSAGEEPYRKYPSKFCCAPRWCIHQQSALRVSTYGALCIYPPNLLSAPEKVMLGRSPFLMVGSLF